MAAKDPTFVAFTPAQAAAYAAYRGHSYPWPLYQAILDYHQGPRDLLLDVGTGPGKVPFDVLDQFTTIIGTDTSAGMVGEAQKRAAAGNLADEMKFLQGSGEQCDASLSSIGVDKADVITVAMAAHWMDLPAFYAAASRALRPGGTLAMWTCTSLYAHPSTPNVAEVQAALSELEDGLLEPYHNSGTKVTRAAYRTIDLPWTSSPPVPEFVEKDFVRVDWDKDGIPSAPKLENGEAGPFLKQDEFSLEEIGKALGSASSVIRYREANPAKAGTAEDPVVLTIERMRKAMGGKERLVVRPSTHLLLFRRA